MAGMLGDATGSLGKGISEMYSKGLLDSGLDENTFDSIIGNAMSNGQSSKNKHKQVSDQYSQAPDMSQYGNMGSLLSMSNAMPQQPQRQNQQMQIDDYLKSLLG